MSPSNRRRSIVVIAFTLLGAGALAPVEWGEVARDGLRAVTLLVRTATAPAAAAPAAAAVTAGVRA